MPGEIYSMTSERGWWIRNKANELIERKKGEMAAFCSFTLSKEIVMDALIEAIIYSRFWANHKYCKTPYPDNFDERNK